MAFIVMAFIVMAFIVMAFIVMAYVVMDYIVMAFCESESMRSNLAKVYIGSADSMSNGTGIDTVTHQRPAVWQESSNGCLGP